MTVLSLRNQLIAAVPVPFDRQGNIDPDAQRDYTRHLADQGIDGVAVWAHTGRGLRLSDGQRGEVLRAWREGLGPEKRVIAAAGGPPDCQDWHDYLDAARKMADQAADGGADAVMVHPPTLANRFPDRDDRVEQFHESIAGAGLPTVLFYLYERAGGISYPNELLDRLLGRPEVVGIKVATLDSVMTFQDVARLVRERHPEKALITGEDRFLGYSLMAGANAALIGMGAACTAVQAALLRSYWAGDGETFLRLNPLVDRLALRTFFEPMEGYIRRMLWCLVHQGVIPLTAAYDPWGPELPETEFDELGPLVRELTEGPYS